MKLRRTSQRLLHDMLIVQECFNFFRLAGETYCSLNEPYMSLKHCRVSFEEYAFKQYSNLQNMNRVKGFPKSMKQGLQHVIKQDDYALYRSTAAEEFSEDEERVREAEVRLYEVLPTAVYRTSNGYALNDPDLVLTVLPWKPSEKAALHSILMYLNKPDLLDGTLAWRVRSLAQNPFEMYPASPEQQAT